MKTYCNKLLAAAMLALFASGAAGHAIHTHAFAQPEQQHGDPVAAAEISKLSVDELIQQYSLVGDDALLEAARARLPKRMSAWSPAQQLQGVWLAQALHEFENARTLLNVVLEQQPNNGQAWLLEAAVANVMGDEAGAKRACGFVAQSVSADAAVICFATLANTPQQRSKALARLRQLRAPDSHSHLAGWHWSVQAELERDSGSVEEAEAMLRRAVTIAPTVQARSVLMDLLLEQARYRDALALSADNETVPALVLRRLMAKRGLGENITPAIEQLDKRFLGWMLAKDYRHAREMAMFYLDLKPEPAIAFKLASKNATLQKEPEDLALLQRATKMQRASR